MSDDRKPLVKIGGLWKGKPGSNTVLSGTLEINGETARCLIFKNEHKRNEREPDFRLVVEEGSFGTRSKPKAPPKPVSDDPSDLSEWGL